MTKAGAAAAPALARTAAPMGGGGGTREGERRGADGREGGRHPCRDERMNAPHQRELGQARGNLSRPDEGGGPDRLMRARPGPRGARGGGRRERAGDDPAAREDEGEEKHPSVGPPAEGPGAHRVIT